MKKIAIYIFIALSALLLAALLYYVRAKKIKVGHQKTEKVQVQSIDACFWNPGMCDE